MSKFLKLLLLLFVVAAIVAAIWYFILRKKSPAEIGKPPISPEDAAAFNDVIAIIKADTISQAGREPEPLGELLRQADENYNPTGTTADFVLNFGKTGALISSTFDKWAGSCPKYSTLSGNLKLIAKGLNPGVQPEDRIQSDGKTYIREATYAKIYARYNQFTAPLWKKYFDNLNATT